MCVAADSMEGGYRGCLLVVALARGMGSVVILVVG